MENLAGKTIFGVYDEKDQLLSVHVTEDGAKKNLQNYRDLVWRDQEIGSVDYVIIHD